MAGTGGNKLPEKNSDGINCTKKSATTDDKSLYVQRTRPKCALHFLIRWGIACIGEGTSNAPKSPRAGRGAYTPQFRGWALGPTPVQSMAPVWANEMFRTTLKPPGRLGWAGGSKCGSSDRLRCAPDCSMLQRTHDVCSQTCLSTFN